MHACLGPLTFIACLPLPPPPPQFSSAAMMVQSILENKRVGLSRVAVHAITKKLGRGGGGGGARHFIPKLPIQTTSPRM